MNDVRLLELIEVAFTHKTPLRQDYVVVYVLPTYKYLVNIEGGKFALDVLMRSNRQVYEYLMVLIDED